MEGSIWKLFPHYYKIKVDLLIEHNLSGSINGLDFILLSLLL